MNEQEFIKQKESKYLKSEVNVWVIFARNLRARLWTPTRESNRYQVEILKERVMGILEK